MKIAYFSTFDKKVVTTYVAEGTRLEDVLSGLISTGELDAQGEWSVVPDSFVVDKTVEELSLDFEQSIDRWLDTFAQTRKYRDIVSAVSYVSSSNPAFKCEALYLADLRDRVWIWANAYMAEVLAGERPIPAWEAFLAELVAEVEPEWPIDDPRIGEE